MEFAGKGPGGSQGARREGAPDNTAEVDRKAPRSPGEAPGTDLGRVHSRGAQGASRGGRAAQQPRMKSMVKVLKLWVTPWDALRDARPRECPRDTAPTPPRRIASKAPTSPSKAPGTDFAGKGPGAFQGARRQSPRRIASNAPRSPGKVPGTDLGRVHPRGARGARRGGWPSNHA